jgi:hypothetical protein
MVALFEQAQRNEDFTALTRLEKLIPLKEFCERVAAGVLHMRDLSPSLRKRVLQATFEREQRKNGIVLGAVTKLDPAEAARVKDFIGRQKSKSRP